MANRLFKQFSNTLEAGVVKLYGKVVTSTSGTVSSTSCKGFAVTKTAAETGRYTVTLEDKFKTFLGCRVTVAGAADAAYATAKGFLPFVRNVAVDTGPTFNIQFADKALADAELDDAASFYIEITLKNSDAY